MARSIAVAPAWSMGATYIAAARSAGVVLDNAAANQRAGQIFANAGVAAVCVKILEMGANGSDLFLDKPLPDGKGAKV